MNTNSTQKEGTKMKTVLTEKIASTLDYSRRRHSCVLIQGRTGRGKTEAVKLWLTQHPDAYYLDCPADGGLKDFKSTIFEAVGVSDRRSLAAKRPTLILDECARLVPGQGTRARKLEYLRRLHDMYKIGLAFVATDFFLRECCNGNLGEYLEQFIGRFRDKLIIPDYVGKHEIRDIMSGFIKDPNDRITLWGSRIANATGTGGARRLWWLMEDASEVSRVTGQPLTLSLLQAVLKDYEGKNRLPSSEAQER